MASELTSLLEHQFGFVVVRDRRHVEDAKWSLSMDQPALIDRRRELDTPDLSQWMLYATQAICKYQNDDRPLVIDHLDSLEQLLHFRQVFRANLVYV